MIIPEMFHSLYRKMCALALVLLGLGMMLNMTQAQAQGQAQGGGGFDHMATEFPLTGSHEQVRCETCHIKGIFKSTPKLCASCHVVGNQRDAVAMSAKHIPQTAVALPGFACDVCHNTSSFSAVQFNHSMASTTCSTCHDGSHAPGKSANHFPTGLQCDQCHSSVAFLPVPRFFHDLLNGDLTTCANCHNGSIAKGMPNNHLPRSNSAMCGSCHKASQDNGFTSFAGGQMDHTGLNTGCADCHGPSITGSTFAGVSSIVVMPPTAPVGPNAHIPSSTTCETCHRSTVPAGLMAANATSTAPGTTAFLTAAVPTAIEIHTGITGGCSSCHDTGMVWMGMSVASYAIRPTAVTTGAQYKGFQTRPVASASTFSVADSAHPTGECSLCHAGTTYFSGEVKPANHIPYANTAGCTACHTLPDFTLMPTLASIHANAQSTTTNCAQCHAADVVDGFKTAHLTIVGPPTNHMPITTPCETCHFAAGSSVTPGKAMAEGTKFNNSLMSHSGITTGCVNCHVASGTTVSFAGITQIVGMPATSPMGPNAHIPSSTTCENCHLSATPKVLVAANATKSAPGTAFLTAAVPLGTDIHKGITGGCSNCHDTGMVWMGMTASLYAINPTKLTNGAQYKGFQTRPVAAASTFSVADSAHPDGECSQCHTGTTYFSATPVPANHIPYAGTAKCTSCHLSTDYTAMPSLANIHANAPSTTADCARCHAANVVDGFKTAHLTIVGPPTNHMPITTPCENCHLAAGSSVTPGTPMPVGAKFNNSLMSHTGITSGCENCHVPSGTPANFAGITSIVGMPATSPMGPNAHIPSSTTCVDCHKSATPVGLVAANATKTAPGTAFLTAGLPLGPDIHKGISNGCSNCHDSNMVWMGMTAGLYTITPNKVTAGAQYKGFQTRPLATPSTAFGVVDALHPDGECSQCHTGTTYFSATPLPTNHIPYASTAQCVACHTTSNYSTMPTLADIHANIQSTTANCAQCHAADKVGGFKTAHLTIIGPPTNHMPITTPCENCHLAAGSSVTPGTPMPEGTKFNNSLMSHTGITTSCVSCHVASGTTISFAGITSIVKMPVTTPAIASSHIPSSTICEDCHLSVTPGGLMAANATKTAPGTAFLTAGVPIGADIHKNIKSGCSNCHDSNMVWMGMSVASYAINPSQVTTNAQYKGFQTRPLATPGTAFGIVDKSHPAGECSSSGCHTQGTAYFIGELLPSNHIPISTAALSKCSLCHTTSDYTAMPTLANIHANAPSTTANCAQCHAANVVDGFKTTHLTIVGPPTNHMPITTPCENCHLATGSSVTPNTPMPDGTKFNNSLMSHTGITSGCVSCHVASGTTVNFAGVTSIVKMPATSPAGVNAHIPSSTICEDCHLSVTPKVLMAANATKTAPGTAFLTAGVPIGTDIHKNITSGCANCHDTGMVWMGMSASLYAINPTTVTTGAQYKGFQTRPVAAAGTFNVADAAHPAGECSNSGCHSGTTYFSGEVKPSNHIPYASTALCSACHKVTDFTQMPKLADIHANAQSTTANCAQCHAANVVDGFKTTHLTIVGPPTNHMPITTPCENCHLATGSSVTPNTPMPDGTKFNNSLMSHNGITKGCVSCHVPSGTTINFAGITRIVGMPATSPVGVNAHIPSSTVCEDCHTNAIPGGAPMPANATKTAPGTAFLTAGVPIGTDIHKNITSGCANCHDTGMVWMGMSASLYAINPTTVTTGAQYKGFQTRPVAAAGTFNVADAAHPAGECSNSGCHSGTTYFSGDVKPVGHMPNPGGAACATCHPKSGDYSLAGLTTDKSATGLHFGINATTGDCIACHASVTKFASCAQQTGCASPPPLTWQPVMMPLATGGSPTTPSVDTHVPTVGIQCGGCHTNFTSFGGMNMIGNTTAHTAVTKQTCMSCHEYNYKWKGVTNGNGIFSPRSGTSHHGRTYTPTIQDCRGCHSGDIKNGAFNNGARVRPVMPRVMAAGNNRVLPRGMVGSVLMQDPGQVFSHAGVAQHQCLTCHNGQLATGLPAVHTQTSLSCDNCHRTTAWKPAQFSHQGVLQGQCQTCHNTVAASGRPAGHFVTTRSCDTCHKTVAWLPVSYSHVSPQYQAQPGTSNCVNCHVTNGEIIPRQMRGNNRPRPVPVHTGP